MKETHGVIAKKAEHAYAGDERTVRVVDGAQLVLLLVGTSLEWAAMTPAEARFIAKQLVAAASRVEPKP